MSGVVDEAAFASAFNSKYQEYCEDSSLVSPSGGASMSIRNLLSSSKKQRTTNETKNDEDEDSKTEHEDPSENLEERLGNMSATQEYFSKSRNVPKDIKCFNCGMRGHMKVDCPKAKNMRCVLCALTGHEMQSCPERRCILCTKRGHLASDCPEKNKIRYTALHCEMCGSNVCHVTDSCPKIVSSRKQLYNKLICIVCGEFGHLRCDKVKQGSEKNKKKKKPGISCYNCGSQFHDGSDCKLPRESTLLRMHRSRQSASVATSIRSGDFGKCWNCNSTGHISRDCPNKNSNNNGGGRRMMGRGGWRGGRGRSGFRRGGGSGFRGGFRHGGFRGSDGGGGGGGKRRVQLGKRKR